MRTGSKTGSAAIDAPALRETQRRAAGLDRQPNSLRGRQLAVTVDAPRIVPRRGPLVAPLGFAVHASNDGAASGRLIRSQVRILTGAFITFRARSRVVLVRCVWKKELSLAIAGVTYSSLSYSATWVAPSIQKISLGSRACQNASEVMYEVAASRPTIMSSGRGAMKPMNRNASKDAMRSTLLQGMDLAERGCCPRSVQ